MNRLLLTAAALCLLLGAATAGPCQPQQTVILAHEAFTGHQFVTDVAIVIEGGFIRDVVPSAGYVPVAGARIIDAHGMTVTPGFMDSHVHVLGAPLEVLEQTAQRGWGRLAEESVSQAPGKP